MNREQKAATIEAIAAEIDQAEAVFAVDYRGISVPQAAELRTKLREADATFTVVKNSLTERAADQAGAEPLKAHLVGPTALTFVRGDVALAAKAVADYAKATQLLPFKGGMMGGEELEIDQIRSLSRLPSRDVLYGQLVGIVASPVGGLVRSLNALLSGVAVALGQVQQKKESGEIPAGEAPAAEAADAEAEAPAEAAPDAETAPEPEAEGEAPAEEAAPEADAAAAEEDKAEPEAEAPAQEDENNQADVSAEAEDAETNPTKED